jgi:hypothetical protein
LVHMCSVKRGGVEKSGHTVVFTTSGVGANETVGPSETVNHSIRAPEGL